MAEKVDPAPKNEKKNLLYAFLFFFFFGGGGGVYVTIGNHGSVSLSLNHYLNTVELQWLKH